MKELSLEINSKYMEFYVEMSKSLNGNKAAGSRARKASKELEKLLKQYRKETLKAAKK